MPKVKLSESVNEWRCIGKNIEMLMLACGMPRKEFCKKMNICDGILSNWVRGKRPVPTDRIYQAARILKTTPAALVTPREISENILRFRPMEDMRK